MNIPVVFVRDPALHKFHSCSRHVWVSFPEGIWFSILPFDPFIAFF